MLNLEAAQFGSYELKELIASNLSKSSEGNRRGKRSSISARRGRIPCGTPVEYHGHEHEEGPPTSKYARCEHRHNDGNGAPKKHYCSLGRCSSLSRAAAKDHAHHWAGWFRPPRETVVYIARVPVRPSSSHGPRGRPREKADDPKSQLGRNSFV